MQSFVLRGWDLVLCLALEALVAVMLTFGVVREVYRETSPRESMGASHRPAPEDLAKEAEFRRLVDFEATSEDRIEARRAVERREHDVKAFAEQYVLERMGAGMDIPWLWMRGDYRIHTRPHGWLVEGIVLQPAGNCHADFWSVEIATIGDGVQGSTSRMEGQSLIWDLKPVMPPQEGKPIELGPIVRGERDPDYPRLIFKD